MTFNQLAHASDGPGLGMFAQLDRSSFYGIRQRPSLGGMVYPLTHDNIQNTLWEAGIYLSIYQINTPDGQINKEVRKCSKDSNYVDYLLAKTLLKTKGIQLTRE